MASATNPDTSGVYVREAFAEGWQAKEGGYRFQSCTTPEGRPSLSMACIPAQRVVPVIFVPGIMGSNLKAKTGIEDSRGNVVIPADTTLWRVDSTLTLAKEWLNRKQDQYQLRFQHDKVAVDAYKRMVSGFGGEPAHGLDGWIKDWIGAKALGPTGDYVTPALALNAGPLELLPNARYNAGKPWLRVVDDGGTVLKELPKLGGAHYAMDSDHRAYANVTWKLARTVDAERHARLQRERLPNVTQLAGMDIYLREGDWGVHASLSAPDATGDGTVPAQASAMAVDAAVKEGDLLARGSGYAHEASYDLAGTSEGPYAALQAIVRVLHHTLKV